MYELVKINDHDYYIESPAKMGLVRLNEKDVVLIDSGNDKNAGRKVRQILDQKGWNLTAIYNTHSNADHIGGNRYLQTQTGCRIFAPGIEADFTNHPILEPSFLYGGFPSKDLRHKFLLAAPSAAEKLERKDLPQGLEMIPLPGHFFEMAGFKTDRGTIYLADCLSDSRTLKKYGIPFIYDVESYLKTLEMVEKMEGTTFVPAHAPATEQIADLARENIAHVHSIAKKILDFCKEPILFEELLKKLFDFYGLTLNMEQYALAGSTVRSFLSWLKDQKKLETIFQDNRLLWKAL